MIKRVALMLLLVWLIGAQDETTSAQSRQTLIVFAAASLTDAFTAIGAAFERDYPGVEVLFNFGGSSALAAQLDAGAPADLFASANLAQMRVAVESGRVIGAPVIFARNRLVVITPTDNPAGIMTLGDLARPGVQLIVAAPNVPVRVYTDAMLERLAADPRYGEDFRAAALSNIVSEEPNVRQVAAKVALGEADAGVVYLSDVTPEIAGRVQMIAVPDAFNTLAAYPIAVTNEGNAPELAESFLAYIMSETGQRILRDWNFIAVRCLECAGLSRIGQRVVDAALLAAR